MPSPDAAKAIADAMVTLWLHEFPATVQVLSAVPDGARDYRPAEKSRSAWQLVTHMATSDAWFIDGIMSGTFAFDAEATKRAEAQFTTVAEVVAWYEQTIPAKLEQLRGMPAEALAVSLDFFGMMQMSRAEWVGFAGNHSVHHRGQLSAYLRSMGAKVPAIYGPSADSEPMG